LKNGATNSSQMLAAAGAAAVDAAPRLKSLRMHPLFADSSEANPPHCA
jgi:hypothetical protein